MKRKVSAKKVDDKPNKKQKGKEGKGKVKQTADYAEKLLKNMTVACTGARDGEVLCGFRNTTDGAIMKGGNQQIVCTHDLKVSGALIPPRTKELESMRAFPEIWERFLEKLGGLSFFSKMTTEERKAWLEENETATDLDMAEIPGVKVEILQLGKSNFLDLEDEQIDSILGSGGMLAKDVRDMFPRKPGSEGIRGRQTLIFYRQYWSIVVTHKQAKEHTGFVIDVENGRVLDRVKADKAHTVLLFDDMPKTLKKSGKSWTPAETHIVGFLVPDKGMKWDEATVDEILIEIHKCEKKEIQAVRKLFKNFTCAGYKSLLQKIIRFAPEKVSAAGTEYPADLVLTVASAALLLAPGSFVPDIQKFVSGLESLTKRLVVIYFEDSCVNEDTKKGILTLCSSAFVAHRVKTWRPSRELVVKYFQLAIKAWKESCYFVWKTPEGAALPPYAFKLGNDEIQLCSAILDDVRSFASDLSMVRYIAKNYKDTVKSGPKNFVRPSVMPLSHCIDQHWAPEIVYFYPYSLITANKASGSKPYSNLFLRVFREVTGVNPRKIKNFDLKKFEEDKFVVSTRLAQAFVLESKQVIPEVRKKIGDKKSYKLEYALDKSWIAGMIGAIDISGRPAILTTLQPEDPEQIIAIKKPSRDMKNAILTPEQEEVAIMATRKRLIEGEPLNKTKAPIPTLKGAKLVLRETEEEEESDGASEEEENTKGKSRGKANKKETAKLVSREYFLSLKDAKNLVRWEDVREDSVDVPYIEPFNKKEGMYKTAITKFADGIQENAWTVLKQELKKMSPTVIRRALMYISGFKQNFEMGRVSRDGGGTKQAVIAEDVGAFQLLTVICVLFPAALRRQKGTATVFEVPLAPLLWKVRETIALHLAEDVDYDSKKWGGIDDKLERVPWQHQLDSLEEMKAAHNLGRKGHFIWIPVGMGKTWIVLSYLKFLMSVNKLPKYVVYTLPSSAIKSIIHEVQGFGFAVNLIVPTKSAGQHPLIKYVQRPGKSDVEEFTVNLIEHDHLRLCEERFASVAPQCIFVIDEVHKALNETKRTSVALSLSHLAEEFVALTGTPIIDSNTYKLIWWLEQIVPFEVNERNFWVAANAMVAKKVNTGVLVEREEVIPVMDGVIQHKYTTLVPPGLGGSNANFGPKYLREAIELCYETCTTAMIDLTAKCVKLKKGVMIVAHNSHHQTKLLKGLIKKGIAEKDIFVLSAGNSIFLTDQTVEEKKEYDYKVVITTIRKSEGYTLTRLNTLITSVYPSNNATREQIEGRINRIGQKAKSVTFYTVHCGILSYILKKHKDARNLSAVLETLADEIKFIKGTEFC